MSGYTPDHLYAKHDPPTVADDDFKSDGDDCAGKGGGLGEGLAVEFNGTE